ncbi:O-antigen ligase domain-containing protein [Allorhodopirellula heiligendammensis]|uniref:O-Antigen ligase n=1 Tax=Allorhodopirellula heiligendammensis TaxID=2714739 RepID=A0A5C6C435_9BACT|nr:O-antigen ligase domain-containing protein [Allorhodopirellula heiligendammensis]TWU18064.1 hypothetical protein Poly21_02190 [Allorhodopirellula heiligendammensis]
MSFLVPIALFTWIPFVILLHLWLPARKATSYAFAAGWCFLPMAGYALPALPDYTKMSATSVGALMGIAISAPHLLMRFRFSRYDVPVAIFMIEPFFTSVTNGLGPYDGLASTLTTTVTWVLPYAIGRVVYCTPQDIESLVTAILVCGLLYVPLCLWEIRMSPQLHLQVYGFYQHSFAQTMRGGGFRPIVFMQHGLQVALWMGGCVILVGFLWIGARVKKVSQYPVWLVAVILGGTFVLLKSLGALVLVALGCVALALCKLGWTRSAALLFPLLLCGYIGGRVTGTVSGERLIETVTNYASKERADSLKFRFDNENLLIDKALQRPILGWGGWDRNRVRTESGGMTTTDGWWIILLGIRGSLGMICFYLMLLWAPTVWLLKSQPKTWHLQPAAAMVSGLAVIAGMNAIDSLPNAMIVPITIVSSGAIVSVVNARKSNVVRRHPGAPVTAMLI